MGMLKRGAEPDLARAAVYFVRWWREAGGLLSASSALRMDDVPLSGDISSSIDSCTQGWGFDFQWEVQPKELLAGKSSARIMQEKMEQCIDQYVEASERDEKEETNISPTQKKKQAITEEKLRRKMKHAKK